MSPYMVSIATVVKHYDTSRERTRILHGLLDFRAALRSIGIVDGFQWIDGSFVEDVEKVRNRAPQDVDLVTFAHRPKKSDSDWKDLIKKHITLFQPQEIKAKYYCDAYFVDLDKPPLLIVDDTRYWFGLFSHQRVTALWKGLLSVPLQSDDDKARLILG